MPNSRIVHIPEILIIMGTMISFLYLCIAQYIIGRGDSCVELTGLIAIAVALIGVMGGIWVQILQFKKDGNTIGTIKSDTSEIKPGVSQISTDVKEIKDDVVRTLLPQVNQIPGVGGDLRKLVDDLEYKKRLKAEQSAVPDKDLFITQVDNLYEENARMFSELKEQRRINQQLKLENHTLKQENRYLQKQLGQESNQDYSPEFGN